MALTAAASGHTEHAMRAGLVSAATALVGIMIMTTTWHRDTLTHHNVPSLLNDTWERTPPFARRRGKPAGIETDRRH
ncbi:hypothetical protein JK358_06625 [Nocardia sp. 2]|uniref:Uncharacterized protein n=1 Tax=Nocardia acididurans TaxID=2802282 RepID=A0ABS1M0M5_9NOCA|nr:hypothetical protein [Nocardia acididurans]MBL1074066.1 hypothetical protein [Nocardia acididurans]